MFFCPSSLGRRTQSDPHACVHTILQVSFHAAETSASYSSILIRSTYEIGHAPELNWYSTQLKSCKNDMWAHSLTHPVLKPPLYRPCIFWA